MRRKTTRRAPVRKAAPRRRRRISGVGSSNVVMQIAGLAGGAILARVANNLILKAKPDLNGKIINAVQIGLGVYLPKMMKSDLGKNLGAGMIAAGGLGLATNFGVIGAIDEISGVDDAMMEVQVSGTDNLEVISGYGEDFGFSDTMSGLDVVSGIDEDEHYY